MPKDIRFVEITIGLVSGIAVILILQIRTVVSSICLLIERLKIDKKTADLPVSFGYKCAWYALKTADTSRVATVLGLKKVKPCSWKAGIFEAYRESVYVTPPVAGWTLVVGWQIIPVEVIGRDMLRDELLLLSREFGEAQLFTTHRVSEGHAWMKAINGRLLRSYVYSGDSGEIEITGEPTGIERSWQLADLHSEEARRDDYYERNDIVWPNEEIVMQVAGDWSVDPTTLHLKNEMKPARGLLGRRD